MDFSEICRPEPSFKTLLSFRALARRRYDCRTFTSHLRAGMTAVPPAAMPNFEGLSGRLLQEKIKQTNQEMRRVKNAGNDKDALAAISATLDALKGRARAEENIKEQITVKSKSAKLCSDTAEAQKIEAEVTSLKRQLQELTGEEYHRNKERRKKQKVEPLQEPPGPAEFPPYTPRDFFRFEIVHQSQKPGSCCRRPTCLSCTRPTVIVDGRWINDSVACSLVVRTTVCCVQARARALDGYTRRMA
jgi:hypothetical protein